MAKFWVEDFGGERYAITVEDGGAVSLGYDGRRLAEGTWDGRRLRVTFWHDHFYGRAQEPADPAFIADLERRIDAHLRPPRNSN